MVRTKDMLGLPEDNVAMIPIEGEVLALLTPVDDLYPGLYMIDSVEFGWASLRLLQAEIAALGQGRFEGTDRERRLVQLLARIVEAELKYRAEDPK